MKRRVFSGIITLVLFLFIGAQARGGDSSGKTVLQIEGSTTVGPIAEAFAEIFTQEHPEVILTVKKTGSGDGAAALVDGRCNIAAMSRFMEQKEFKAAVDKGVLPVAHSVALDGVCVIVHPSNPVGALSEGQLRDIYAGKKHNWKELGGADMAIVKISRDTSSGTYETFYDRVMKKQALAADVEYVNSSPQAYARVKTTVGAISYVGIGFLDENVKAVSVNGVKPSAKTIASGRYPLARPLFFFTNGFPEPGTLLYEFCTLYLTEKGQEVIQAKGFVPLTSY